MAKIIQLTGEMVTIGMDDGSILTVSPRELNFMPSLGDEVQVFRNENQIIVSKVEKKQEVQQPQVVINNSNMNTNTNTNINANGFPRGKMINKWVALLLCFFFGVWGIHKFYEGKIGMGILYIFTFGLIGFGVLIDFFVILFKPNPYYV